MKFYDYLNEETVDSEYTSTVISKIKKDCQPFLNILKGSENMFLYRGMNNKGLFKKITVRKDRKPLDSKKEDHDKLNSIFFDKFGWHTRSEGVFCVGNKDFTLSYGDVTYTIFPIGNFKFVWSPKIADIFREINLYKIRNDNGKITDGDFKNILTSYTDKNLKKAIISNHEIVIKCNEYYAVRLNTTLQKELNNITMEV